MPRRDPIPDPGDPLGGLLDQVFQPFASHRDGNANCNGTRNKVPRLHAGDFVSLFVTPQRLPCLKSAILGCAPTIT